MTKSNIYPDIKFSWKKSFRDSHCVEESPRDVERPHEDEPTDGHLFQALLPAVDNAVMRGRGDPTQTEEDEHPC